MNTETTHTPLALARAHIGELPGALTGDHNNNLSRVAELGFDFGVSLADWIPEVLEWNKRRNAPPLPEREVASLTGAVYSKLQRTSDHSPGWRLRLTKDDDDLGTPVASGTLYWDPEDGSGRWQCESRGIHAGNMMEVELAVGCWVACRIESADSGRKLFAFFGAGQLIADRGARGHRLNLLEGVGEIRAALNPNTVRLRWPEENERPWRGPPKDED